MIRGGAELDEMGVCANRKLPSIRRNTTTMFFIIDIFSGTRIGPASMPWATLFSSNPLRFAQIRTLLEGVTGPLALHSI